MRLPRIYLKPTVSAISRLTLILIVLILAAGIGTYVAYQLAGSNTLTTSVSSTTSSSTSASVTGTISSIYSSTTSAITQTEDNGSLWLVYHRDQTRDGYDPTEKATNNISLSWKTPHLDGDVYAEPLIAEGKIFIATENDSVYALNESTGSIEWKTELGLPVPGSALPCGDIDPSGITSTPVIDLETNSIYVVAFLKPIEHFLFGISLTNGFVNLNRSVDPISSNFDASVQQQRGALALSGGIVYIPYGGLDGDCGQYHGWLVGVTLNGSGSLMTYMDPTSREGGIWATSGPAIDSSGNILVTTGNSEATSSFDFGDAVIKLSPTLQELDYFAPTDWASLNSGDVDLGSVGPSILGSNTIFQIGKEGVGYLLSDSNLGQIGGEIFNATVCGSAFGGNAYSAPYLYVPCTDGLVALNVSLGSSKSFSTVWEDSGTAYPPIVAGGAVWSVIGGSLEVLNPVNGSTIFSYRLSKAVHFITPSSADGHVVIAAGSEILSFAIVG